MEYILPLPKAEVHIHLESMLDVDTIYSISSRLGLESMISKEEFHSKVESYSCLSDMLQLLNIILTVPQSYIDIYHLLMPIYSKLHSANVVYIEPSIIFNSFSLHPSEVVKGFIIAKNEAESLYGIKSNLIYSFSRNSTIERMKSSMMELHPYKDLFVGINAAGNEENMPACQIKELYQYAEDIGLCRNGNKTIHTGEEASPDHIIGSLALLGLKRIDHGVRAAEDPHLLKFLGDSQFNLAMCPFSNRKLKVYDRFCEGKSNLHKFIEAGCKVSINSDDPYLLGCFTEDVYMDVYREYGEGLPGGMKAYVDMVKNGFSMSFMEDCEKERYIKLIDSQVQHLLD